jgi:hypothetical protein
MYVMSTWALASMTLPKFRNANGFALPADPVPWVGLVLLSLAAVLLVEAIRVLAIPQRPQGGIGSVTASRRAAGA